MISVSVATALGTFLVAAGSPGPATLAVAGASMASGRCAGLALGAGLAAGLAIWGVTMGLGFGVLVAQSPVFLAIFKVIGGGYLLYLAWMSGRSAMAQQAAPVALASGRAFRRGLILNLANPKAALAWIAALALGSGDGVAGWGVVAACAVLGAVIYGIYAMAFALDPVRMFYARARRGIEVVTAGLFALAGLRLLTWRGV